MTRMTAPGSVRKAVADSCDYHAGRAEFYRTRAAEHAASLLEMERQARHHDDCAEEMALWLHTVPELTTELAAPSDTPESPTPG